MTLGFCISIAVTLFFLIWWDLTSWHEYHEFYLKFEQNRIKEMGKTSFFEKVMKDYEKRYHESSSNSYNILRRNLIESNLKIEYWVISLSGSLLYFSFFMLDIVGITGYIFPTVIITFSAIVVKYKCNSIWLGLKTNFWFLLRSLFVMIAVNLFISFMNGDVPFFLSPGDQVLYRTIEDTDWFLSLAGISFSFAIGLFIVLSLTPLLYKGISRIKEVQLDTIKLYDDGKTKASEFYKKNGFSELYEKYDDARLAPRNILGLTYLIIVFIAFGVLFMHLYMTS